VNVLSKSFIEQCFISNRYIQEWLGGMIGAGIVQLHDGRYSLPYKESDLRQWGHATTLLPIFFDQFTKLENVMEKDGPNGLFDGIA
jgi:hypothetical protein